MISYDEIKNNKAIKTYIQKADEALGALGYTEHSFAHVTTVSKNAKYILIKLGYDKREAELAEIAGYLHDIGNMVNRNDHAQGGALLAFRILDEMKAEPSEIATIVSAIGNHDEGTAVVVSNVAAALILADKSDVRRSRVRNREFATFDIHDRVNYAVYESSINISEDKKSIVLKIEIDTKISAVMDYFEIFMQRMLLCRKAAEKLNLKFKLIINDQELL